MPIVVIRGWSGSGKTTLGERLCAELEKRGRKTAGFKYAHSALKGDKSGTDSKRFSEAASSSGVTDGLTLIVHGISENHFHSPESLKALFPHCEWIIAEGAPFSGDLCLEVVTPEGDGIRELKTPSSDLSALILPDKPDWPLSDSYRSHPLFQRNDIRLMADFLEEHFE